MTVQVPALRERTVTMLGTSPTYPVGWTHAMDTPMPWTKQIASHYGGTGNGIR